MTPMTVERQQLADEWRAVEREGEDARQALTASPPGIARHVPFNRVLGAQQRCRQLIHRWLGSALHVEAVTDPRLVLSLDVDALVEIDGGTSCSVGLTGAAALRLLQLGRVVVLANTARSLAYLQDFTARFALRGGTATRGAALWDGVRASEQCLITEAAMEQLGHLRIRLRAEPEVLQDETDCHSVSASRLVDGYAAPISGQRARGLLERYGLGELGFWVGRSHTNFVDRSVDKADGLAILQRELALDGLPQAAMGTERNDVPLLRSVTLAFLPAASVPSYRPPRQQRLVRSRYVGEAALWDVACCLVPNAKLQAQVLDAVGRLELPEWFPSNLGWCPALGCTTPPAVKDAVTAAAHPNRTLR